MQKNRLGNFPTRFIIEPFDAVFVTKDKKVYISEHIPGEFELLDKTFKVVKGVAKE